MANIAIITARGGSKRIPKKNIRSFFGKPIIAYSIEVALQSGLFDEVMVSTDSKEIAAIAIEYGAKVPFFRSEKNSNDRATTVDVIDEVLQEYRKVGKEFAYFCCLYPTAPFLTVDRLEEAFGVLEASMFDAVFPIVTFNYPIQRALTRDKNVVKMLYPENFNKRSQDLLPVYHDCGQFYFMRTNIFLKERKMFVENSTAIIMNEMEAQDIDNEDDWKMAEVKYKILNNIN